MLYYTVYKITNKINGKIYIGLHKTKNLDDGYMGSGKSLRIHQKKFGLQNFEKEILFVFDNPEEMIAKEEELVTEEFVSRSDTYNMMKGGVGGWEATQGTVPVKDKEGNCFRVPVDDQRYLSRELIHPANGRVTVEDENGDLISISVNDARYLSGELVHHLTGFKQTEQAKKNSSEGLKKRYTEKDHQWLGKNHKDETKMKISKASAEHQKGLGNSQFGSKWIYNIELKECKKIKKNDAIPEGWHPGRKMKF